MAGNVSFLLDFNIPQKTFNPLDNRLVRLRAVNQVHPASLRVSSSPIDKLGSRPARNRKIVKNLESNVPSKERVFFLDVNPICYAGNTRSFNSFKFWVSLLFSEVTQGDPIIAVFDGMGGNELRRSLLPSYKAQRLPCNRNNPYRDENTEFVMEILRKCDVPVIRVDGYEADDVVATLTDEVLRRGFKVVIASPDKDFKQLISEDVQMVLPIRELKRWSFYTIKHYFAQYNCHPQMDLSLRCIIGDEVDNIPGLHTMAPGFGRKTAMKLLKKYGSLDNLLNEAAVRTVGKPYAQDALTRHADFLRRNYEVLALRRNVDVRVEEQWLARRNACKSLFTNFEAT